MNRRAFIFTSSAAAVAVPVVYYFKKHQWKHYNPVYTPDFLSSVCDEKTIKEIGKTYMKLTPAESTKEKLKTAVLADANGNSISTKDDTAVTDFINSKITKEFLNGHTLILNGWVLSVTEGRQCALFSLTN